MMKVMMIRLFIPEGSCRQLYMDNYHHHDIFISAAPNRLSNNHGSGSHMIYIHLHIQQRSEVAQPMMCAQACMQCLSTPQWEFSWHSSSINTPLLKHYFHQSQSKLIQQCSSVFLGIISLFHHPMRCTYLEYWWHLGMTFHVCFLCTHRSAHTHTHRTC